VQNGCDSHCAFCIIPTTRGRAESRPLPRILADARRRIAEGHPELVVTGINVGTYRDPNGSGGLPELVMRVGALPGLRRLRISSIEPGTVDAPLLRAMAETPVVAPHLHIPLQAGDDRVLRAMGRGYTREGYRAACERARAALPGLNITTDVIVGFPGEDAAAFAATLGVVREVGMGKVHVFPFSPRPGTRAAGLADDVGHEERRERGRVLRDLSDDLGRARRRARVGSRDRVLVEARHDDGTLGGYGADYTRFVLPPGTGAPGGMVPVRVAGAAGDHLVGHGVA
jgi:threonylcarbamoyladenosine tRNA methylthiotransferase MtaB